MKTAKQIHEAYAYALWGAPVEGFTRWHFPGLQLTIALEDFYDKTDCDGARWTDICLWDCDGECARHGQVSCKKPLYHRLSAKGG